MRDDRNDQAGNGDREVAENGEALEALDQLSQGRGRHMQGAMKLIDLAELYCAAMLISEHREEPKQLVVKALGYASEMIAMRNAVMKEAHGRDMAESGFSETTREDLEREHADAEPAPAERSDKRNPDGSTPTYSMKADTGKLGLTFQGRHPDQEEVPDLTGEVSGTTTLTEEQVVSSPNPPYQFD